MRVTFLTILLIAVLEASWSLICNGDFEGYGLVPDYTKAWVFLFVNSDYSCWYNEIGGPVEVKININPYTTGVV